MIYNDISLHIDLDEFKKINNNSEQYDFITVDKYNKYDLIKLRKNIDKIYDNKNNISNNI